jgi:2-methylisocitrate lyase-like PEP mutase family enzyme
MIERDPKTLARLQAVVTALIEHRVSTSLVDVERALAKWRSGAHSALAAHGAVLRHAARCERTVERVTAAAAAARALDFPFMFVARAENHLHGVDDLDDTIARLVAYRDAGADCVYAPWLSTPEQISAVVDAVGVPVNVLATPAVPAIPDLAELGVRRVSTGSLLAGVAYGALVAAARELQAGSTSTYAADRLAEGDKQAAFGDPNGR